MKEKELAFSDVPTISYGVSTGNAVKQKLASGNWQKGFAGRAYILQCHQSQAFSQVQE